MTSNINKTLAQIPVVAVQAPRQPSQRLHWYRRSVQWGMILLALLIPITGLFRIDPVDGAFVVLDRQIWFSDFFIVFGFWFFVASALVALYSIAGTVFCGWACPQNTFSEWANLLTRRLLGKRAEVMLDGQPMKISRDKDRWFNWFALGLIFLSVSMALALIPLFYFYTPDVVWSFITFQDDARLAGSLHWIYTVFVLIIFLDIVFIRHFMCRFMCIYKVWQHIFKTKETLHIAYDESRSDACRKCNYCVTSCFIDIDPRKTNVFDTCINCGECVTACSTLQAKKNGGPGLLSFAFGPNRRDDIANARTGLSGLKNRLIWTSPWMALGAVMFVWGLGTYEGYHYTVYRSEVHHGAQINEYRINLASKFYYPTAARISVEGLPDGAYTLDRERVEFATAGRTDVTLNLDSQQLRDGLTPFLVRVTTDDGWQDTFRVHHFIGGR